MKVHLIYNSCKDCVFRRNDYCNLAPKIIHKSLRVADFLQEEMVHDKCPLKSNDVRVTLEDYNAS
jgi:hypothetical protein